MKRFVNGLTLILMLATSLTAFAQVEFPEDTTTRPSRVGRYRIGVVGGVIRLVPRTGNTIALGSGVQVINSKTPTAGAVTLTTTDIGEGTNQYFTTARSNTTGDARYPQLGSAYVNPTWLTSIPYAKLTAVPTTLAGFSITDAVNTGGSYANPTWLTSLPFSKLTTTPTTRSGYGITDAEPTITAGTGTQYWVGTKAWATLNTAAVVESTNQYFTTARAQTALTGDLALKADKTATLPYLTVATLAAAQAQAVTGLTFIQVTTDEVWTETNSLYIKVGSALFKVLRQAE